MNTSIDKNISNNDDFAYLNAIASGEIPAPKFSSDILYWTHEQNKPLIGKIVEFGEFEHQAYGTQKTVIVERENGEVVSAILTQYLQNGMVMQDGDIGDLVLIEKQNKERSKNGKIFNKFQLVVKKQ